MIKISFIFAWYDLWVGLFWDKKKRWLYILPIPCCGIILKFEPINKRKIPQWMRVRNQQLKKEIRGND